MTNITSSMVMDVSAMLVAITILVTPSFGRLKMKINSIAWMCTSCKAQSATTQNVKVSCNYSMHTNISHLASDVYLFQEDDVACEVQFNETKLTIVISKGIPKSRMYVIIGWPRASVQGLWYTLHACTTEPKITKTSQLLSRFIFLKMRQWVRSSHTQNMKNL